MLVDRVGADAKFRCDLGVAVTGCGEDQDLRLATGQSVCSDRIVDVEAFEEFSDDLGYVTGHRGLLLEDSCDRVRAVRHTELAVEPLDVFAGSALGDHQLASDLGRAMAAYDQGQDDRLPRRQAED